MSWGRRRFDFRKRAYVMGIINCTPDSFYGGSRKATVQKALEAGRKMVRDGADILDMGGESTRPGSDAVSADEELGRVCPVIEALRRESDVPLSIDTTKAAVAREALRLGCDMVNDVSGLRADPQMASAVAEAGIPVVLMHMRGTPKTMQKAPFYADTVGEIKAELQDMVDAALAGGVGSERIIIDPGIGFGKRVEDNLRIIGGLRGLKSMGFPVLIGLSRKSFIGAVLDRPVDERLIGTVVANTAALLAGADILRVHDVREAVEAVKMIQAVREAGS